VPYLRRADAEGPNAKAVAEDVRRTVMRDGQ
jgi:hypothetical protein